MNTPIKGLVVVTVVGAIVMDFFTPALAEVHIEVEAPAQATQLSYSVNMNIAPPISSGASMEVTA